MSRLFFLKKEKTERDEKTHLKKSRHHDIEEKIEQDNQTEHIKTMIVSFHHLPFANHYIIKMGLFFSLHFVKKIDTEKYDLKIFVRSQKSIKRSFFFNQH